MEIKRKHICLGIIIILLVLILPIVLHKYTDIFTFSIDKVDLIAYSSFLIAIISIVVVFFLSYLGLDHILRLNKVHKDVESAKTDLLNSIKSVEKEKEEMIKNVDLINKKFNNSLKEGQENIKQLAKEAKKVYIENRDTIIGIKKEIKDTYHFDYEMIDLIFNTLLSTFEEIHNISDVKIKEKLISMVYENKLLALTYYNDSNQRWGAIMQLRARASELINKEDVQIRLENIWDNEDESKKIKEVAYKTLIEIKNI